MINNPIQKPNLKTWLKALEAQKALIDKQIEHVRGLLELENGLEKKPVKTRNRPKSKETIVFEGQLKNIFAKNGQNELKFGQLLDEAKILYPESQESKVRSRIIHLQRSGFITRGESYGFYKLASEAREGEKFVE